MTDEPNAPDAAAADAATGEKLGTLYVVATPIGNLDDMTLRAIKVLKEVPVLAAEDTRAAQNLLRHFAIARPTIVSFFEGNEAGRTEHLMARLRGGDDVALISEAGTPGVSDPGARLVAAAVAADIRVVPLPGASAALAALVASGLPVGRVLLRRLPRARRRAARRRRSRGCATSTPRSSSTKRPGRAGADAARSRRRASATIAPRVRGARADQDPRRAGARHAQGAGRALRRNGAARRGHDRRRGRGPGGAEAAVDVEAEVKRRLADGESPKEIAAALALTSGKPRRQIYQLAVALKPRD